MARRARSDRPAAALPDMAGVRLIPSRGGYAIPAGAPSVFSYLFEPMADAMRPLHWYATRYDSSPFNGMVGEPGQEDWYDNAIIALPAQARDGFKRSDLLFRPGTLPDAGRHLGDDWMDLIGIAGGGDRALVVAGELYNVDDNERYDRVIGGQAELYFHCMDGWSWEGYAADADLVRRVAEHVSGNPAVTVQWVTLREKAARP